MLQNGHPYTACTALLGCDSLWSLRFGPSPYPACQSGLPTLCLPSDLNIFKKKGLHIHDQKISVYPRIHPRAQGLVTSQPHPHDIKHKFDHTLKIDVEASGADIKQYCSRTIRESESAPELKNDYLMQQLMANIASRAHGV